MNISFIIQLISEFFPISSSLLLKSLNMTQGEIFHIFNGFLFLIIFSKEIFQLILFPIHNFNKIVNYFFIIFPSVIIGLLTTFNLLYVDCTINYQQELVINLIMSFILLYSISFHENNYKINNSLKDLNITDSIYLGLFLSLNGIFPGMSRLGTSLIYLFFRGYSLDKAYEISLLTSIPIIIGKPLVLLIKTNSLKIFLYNFIQSNYYFIIGSFFISFIIYRIILKLMCFQNLKYIVYLRILYFSFILIQLLIMNSL